MKLDEITMEKIRSNFREEDYEERPEYNALQRLNAIDNLLDIICPTIEEIEALEHGNDEERQLFWDYESKLDELRKLREMLEEDLAEADRDYMNNKDYFDSLDD